MIRSFRDRHTEGLFNRDRPRRFPSTILRTALRKLLVLDGAERLGDLRVPPENRLEKLSGDGKGQYSLRINDRWRVCFVWSEGDAYEVEITDYH